MPIFGSAIPTIEGIKAALKLTGAGPSETQPATWINLREEPVVYIGGDPFVLRAAERPLKNMKEYGHIDTERVEHMETRLRANVLQEAAHYGGQV